MNSFFRLCVMFILLMLTFSFVANFVSALGIFPHTAGMGISGVDSAEDALPVLTDLSDPSMAGIFLGATALTFIGAVALAFLTRSITPIGIHIFGVIFWASWINMLGLFSYGGYIPGEFLLIFTVGVMFVFIAAVVGMLTGSG